MGQSNTLPRTQSGTSLVIPANLPARENPLSGPSVSDRKTFRGCRTVRLDPEVFFPDPRQGCFQVRHD